MGILDPEQTTTTDVVTEAENATTMPGNETIYAENVTSGCYNHIRHNKTATLVLIEQSIPLQYMVRIIFL